MTTKRKYLERKFIILLSTLLFTLPVFAQDYYYTDKLFRKHFVFTQKETEIAVKFRAGVTPTRMRDVMRQSGFSLKTERLEELRYGVFSLPEGMPFSTAKEQLLRNALVAGAVPGFVDQEGYERYIDPEWFTVQFNDNVSTGEAESIISQSGSMVY